MNAHLFKKIAELIPDHKLILYKIAYVKGYRNWKLSLRDRNQMGYGTSYIECGKLGSLTGMKKMIQLNKPKCEDHCWKELFEGICHGGHVELIDHVPLIDTYDGLIAGCLNGQLQIVKRLINLEKNYLNCVFYAACEGGHEDIVNYLIDYGINDWNWGLFGACDGGHIHIVKQMIKKGANKFITAYYKASKKNHHEICDYIMELSPNLMY